MSRIFISHSSTDKKSVEDLCRWLDKEGHTSYFLDFDPDKGIAAGQHWEKELYRHLRQCRVVVALISTHWLASRWCFAEVTQARAAGKSVILAKVADCDMGGIFGDIQHVNLFADSADGYRKLSRGLEKFRIEPGDDFVWDPSRPPFPGLQSFEQEDAAVYFGRDLEIRKGLELLEGLRHRRDSSFILCLGASGSGKSSLMKAGLLPRLLRNSKAWLPVEPSRPQQNPLQELSVSLSKTFSRLGEHRAWRSIYERLHTPAAAAGHAESATQGNNQEEGLNEIARDLRILAGEQDATVILAIDQLEELFGYSQPDSSRTFLRCLRDALETGGHRLMAIATMRSDSLVSFQTHPELQEFSYVPMPVAPLPLRALPQIIEGPAQVAGVKLETGLTQILVQDATTSDALPLLAFTLAELHKDYGHDRELKISEYEDLGRLEGSVRRTADTIIQVESPNAEVLAALRASFVPAMVRVNAEGDFIRQRAAWLQLPSSAHTLLQLFIDNRLLVSRDQDGEQMVEVAHEALLRVWPRLNRWLTEDRDSLRILDDFRHAAEQWQMHEQADSWLIHYGERFEAIEKVVQDHRFAEHVSQNANGYLKACIGKRKQEIERVEREQLAERKRAEAETKTMQRTRTAAVVISIIAAVAIGAAAFGWYQAGIAEKERNQALAAQSKALSLVSRQKTDEGFATLGMLLSLEAIPTPGRDDRPFVTDAEASLLHALIAHREKAIWTGHSDGIIGVATSPEDTLIVTVSRDQTARILDTTTGTITTTLQGHSGQIYWAEFSPDGTQVLTASSDTTARIWNTRTGRMVANLADHSNDVLQARFSPDGRTVATVSADHTARIWDSETGTSVWVLQGHTDIIYWASFSPDGSYLITASADGTSRIWDTGTGETHVTLEGHDKMILHAEFSNDGRRAVTASWDGKARLWEVDTGTPIGSLTGHSAGVSRAVFSPDSKLVATASADGTVRLWDGTNGQDIGTLKGHRGRVHDIQFSPDGRWLVSAADDGIARLWDVNTLEPIDFFGGHVARIWATRFLPDGRHVVTVSEDTTTRLWEVEPETTITIMAGHDDRVHRAVFSPDGHRMVTVSDDKRALIWNVNAVDDPTALLNHDAQVWYADYSPDGEFIATTSADGSAYLWHSSKGHLLHKLEGHSGLVNHAAFSPDSLRLVTGGHDETARVWQVATGEIKLLLPGHKGAVNFVEFSHDGDRILTASQDGSARLWNARNGAMIKMLDGHQGPIVNGAFSPDDSLIVTVSWDKTARLWNGLSGTPHAVLEGHAGAVLSAAFSHDNQLVVTSSSDNTGRLWTAADGNPVQVLQGHQDEVYQASFSPDSRLILTASGDGTARLWHTSSSLPVATLQGHQKSVFSAMFDASGRRVVTASADRTARLWTLPVGTDDDWYAYATDRVPRALLPDEQRLYLRAIDAAPRTASAAGTNSKR